MHKIHKSVLIVLMVTAISGVAFADMDTFHELDVFTNYHYRGDVYPFNNMTKQGDWASKDDYQLLNYGASAWVEQYPCPSYACSPATMYDRAAIVGNMVYFYDYVYSNPTTCCLYIKTMQWGSPNGTGDNDNDGILNNVDTTPNGDLWLDPEGDADNDGIPNGIDPDPYRVNSTFKLISAQYDANGSMTWGYLKDEYGNTFEVGTYDSEQDMYIIGDQSMSAAGYAAYMEGDADFTRTSGLVFGDFQAGTLASGRYTAPGDTDSESLAKITDNTAAQADGQQTTNQGLQSINDNLKILGQTIAGKLTGLATTGAGGITESQMGDVLDSKNLNASDIGTAVGDAVKGSEDGQEDALQDYSTGASDAVGTALGDLQNLKGAVDGEDIPTDYQQKKDLGQGITDVLGEIQNDPREFDIDLQGSGACSFQASVLGGQVTFSLCQYEGILETMGIILIGICGCYCAFIIIGKA